MPRSAAFHFSRPPLPKSRILSTKPLTTSQTPPPAPPADIVCLSGGVESSTLLATLSRPLSPSPSLSPPPRALLPLFTDYAQRAALHERRAALHQVSLCSRLSPATVRPLLTLDISAAGAALRGLTPRRRAHVPLLHRNLPLLALAVSAAAAERAAAGWTGASRVFVAVGKDDLDWYPSAGVGFLERFREVVRGLEPGLEVVAPFVEMGKGEIVRAGCEVGVCWEETYSCMIGGGGQRGVGGEGRGKVCDEELVGMAEVLPHCGRCSQCVARKKAFRDAGVPDGTHGVYLR